MTKSQATDIVIEGLTKTKRYFENLQNSIEPSSSLFDFNTVLQQVEKEILRLIDGQIGSKEITIEQDTLDISEIDVRKLK